MMVDVTKLVLLNNIVQNVLYLIVQSVTVVNLLNSSVLISPVVFQAAMDIPGLNLSQQEYYPYVYYKIDCNLLDFK